MVYSAADHFSECVESHAFETYDKFIKAQGGIMDISFHFSFFLVIYALFFFVHYFWFYAFVIEVWKTNGLYLLILHGCLIP